MCLNLSIALKQVKRGGTMKKCGLYLRVSTEEQASVKEGSLKSQKIRLQALIKSKNSSKERWKVTRIYTEKGHSAKDMNRPQLQMLFDDVRRGNINVVLCTRIDRITRSLLDFYSLFQMFQENKTDFICLDDSFDTSTPIGRMALKMILVFAELEREQIADRTKKCLRTRALSGLWNGGHVLGYDIDRNNPGHLKVNKSEKELVNLIFKTYLRMGTFRKTGKFLNDNGFRTKSYTSHKGITYNGTEFRHRHLSQILKNKIYIGKIEICKRNKKKEQASLHPEQRYRIVVGRQDAIIENKLFTLVQEKIIRNRQKNKATFRVNKPVYLLRGLLYCGECGYPMETTWARGHGGDYFYYRCICQREYIRADIIENRIITKVRDFAFRPYRRMDNSNIKIINTPKERCRFIQFSRRLGLAKGIYCKNILGKIIRKIIYKGDIFTVELR